jgi:hypothetical protein
MDAKDIPNGAHESLSAQNGDIADIIWPAAVDPIQGVCEQIRQNPLAPLLMRAAAN